MTEQGTVSTTAWEKWTTRIVSGLSLLLMAGLPLGSVAAVWSWDWRWLATGFAASSLGFAMGAVITEPIRRARRAAR